MRKINFTQLLLIFMISGALISCHRKQIGYFNNHSPAYAKQKSNVDESRTKSTEQVSVTESKATPSKTQTVNTIKTNLSNKINKSIQTKESYNESKPLKLSKEERKQIKEVIKKKDSSSGLSKVLLVIVAIILPPLAVAFVDGLSAPFWLSILLTLLFYLPGLIYALWRIFRQ